MVNLIQWYIYIISIVTCLSADGETFVGLRIDEGDRHEFISTFVLEDELANETKMVPIVPEECSQSGSACRMSLGRGTLMANGAEFAFFQMGDLFPPAGTLVVVDVATGHVNSTATVPLKNAYLYALEATSIVNCPWVGVVVRDGIETTPRISCISAQGNIVALGSLASYKIMQSGPWCSHVFDSLTNIYYVHAASSNDSAVFSTKVNLDNSKSVATYSRYSNHTLDPKAPYKPIVGLAGVRKDGMLLALVATHMERNGDVVIRSGLRLAVLLPATVSGGVGTIQYIGSPTSFDGFTSAGVEAPFQSSFGYTFHKTGSQWVFAMLDDVSQGAPAMLQIDVRTGNIAQKWMWAGALKPEILIHVPSTRMSSLRNNHSQS